MHMLTVRSCSASSAAISPNRECISGSPPHRKTFARTGSVNASRSATSAGGISVCARECEKSWKKPSSLHWKQCTQRRLHL